MADDAQTNRKLIDKVAHLPPAQAAAVEAFIDELSDRALVKAGHAASEPAFAAAWDDKEDAIYDEL